VGFVTPRRAGGITLREWFPRAVAARPRASAEQKARYLKQFAKYVPDELADMPLEEITEEVAGAWVTGMLEGDGLPAVPSAKTVHNVFGTVSSVVKQAVRNGLVERNTFAGLGAGLMADRAEQVHLSEDEFDLVRSHLQGIDAELAEWLFESGMRFGEATALRWRDLDYAKGTASVVQAWKRGPESVYVLGTPKTLRSRRTIVMPAAILARVRARDPRFQRGRRSLAATEGLVFTMDDGQRVTQNAFYRTWMRAVQQAHGEGLLKTPRIHDLRHSHATLLLAKGVDILTVSRRLGHSSVAVTGDIYGHLGSSSDEAILAALDRTPKKPKKGKTKSA
jgi:integrase